jgi:hypothetical protein
MHVCVYMYTYASLCMHFCVCMYAHACGCMHVCVCMYTYACLCVPVYVYACVHMHVCVCVCVCECVFTCTFICTGANKLSFGECKQSKVWWMPFGDIFVPYHDFLRLDTASYIKSMHTHIYLHTTHTCTSAHSHLQTYAHSCAYRRSAATSSKQKQSIHAFPNTSITGRMALY